MLAFDRDGIMALDGDLTPFGIDTPDRLLHDLSTDTLVVASPKAGLRMTMDGSAIELLEAASPAARVRPAPFSIAPTISMVRPPDGAATHDPDAEIILGLGAACSARACAMPANYVDGLIVDVQLQDGRSVKASIDAETGRAVVRARPALRPGINRLSAQVTDRFGHRAVLMDARLTLLDGADAPPVAGAATTSDTLNEPGHSSIQKAANKPPTVALTSPVNGAVFTAGNAVTLSAIASDSDGSIAKVEFYRSATVLIGTATAPPYTFVWTNAIEGSHALSATAYDNRNGKATSAAVNVTVVGNQGPSIALASPSDGSFHVVGSPITLVASAADPDGAVVRVEFLDGEKALASVSASPWTWTWPDAIAGRHAITVRAIDDRGATSTSTVVYVVVGDGPKVVVTQPAGCGQVDGPVDLVLSADAASTTGTISRVEFFDGASLVGTANSPPWRATLASAAVGTHSITARATDNHGLATTSRAAQVEVRGANQPPSVSLATPADGARYPIGSTVSLTANASDPDGTIAAVEYRIGTAGSLIGRATSPPYAVAWSGMASGTYGLVAVAYDDRGASATSAMASVTIAPNAVPTIALTAPADGGAFVAPATIGLIAAGTDSDGSIAKVEFFSGSTLIGTSTSAPFTATWPNVAAGSYSLTAKATDNLGATAISAPVSVSVTANAPPVVSLGAPVPGARYFAPATIPLAASASDPDGTIARVDFYANGMLVATSTSAPFNAVWDSVAAGTYSLTAVASDAQGASTTSEAIDVLVSAGAAIVATDGLDGSIVDDDNVLVTGTIDAPLNSGVMVNGILAQVDANGRFYANGIPLAIGQNTIVLELTSPDGDEVARSITVGSNGAAAFSVAAEPTDGFAPLEVRFDVTDRGKMAFGRVEFDFDGNGSTDHTALATQFVGGIFAVAATYPAGTFTSTIRVYDEIGALLYATSRVVTARTFQQQDTLLRGVYTGMLDRLRMGKIAAALNAVTGSVHEKYNAVFAALGSALPAAIDTLGTLEANWFSLDQAEYVVVRDTADGPQAFLIDFLRGKDGIWRIEGM
ncbi:MAG TPA: Ig-like domain-containing protein [Casimicrobiaceae bacterium]|nr:Ig-like domain-containing protein [Casimicrobiaceae bacterium]